VQWRLPVLLAYEYAPPERRGLFGSIPQSGVTLGMLLSTLFIGFASLCGRTIHGVGWRVPFVLSAGLVALGLWIRNGIDETPDFTKRKPRDALLASSRRSIAHLPPVKFLPQFS